MFWHARTDPRLVALAEGVRVTLEGALRAMGDDPYGARMMIEDAIEDVRRIETGDYLGIHDSRHTGKRRGPND